MSPVPALRVLPRSRVASILEQLTGGVAGRVGVDEGGRVPLVFKVAHGRVGEGKVVCGGGQRQGRCVGTVELTSRK